MIALVCIAKDEHNLVEWCRYHRAVGFDKIFIYANDWMPAYALPNYVTVIPIAGEVKQLFAYNDWIKRFQKFYTHAAFFDCDEFLFFANGEDVNKLVARLPERHIAINWVMFGSKEEEGGTGIINRFCHRSKNVNTHVKTILHLNHESYMISPHNSNKSGYSPENIRVMEAHNTLGSMQNVFLAHYWTQDADYWERKMKRGRADTGKRGARTKMDFVTHNCISNEVFDDRLKLYYESTKEVIS
jgi:O-antigen biosynthesis protein